MLTRMLPSQAPKNLWQFTVNTEATTAGERKTGIPFNLYGQSVTLDVDWGDGTGSVLTADDYEELDSTASVHEYAEPGIYQISVASSDWGGTCFVICSALGSLTTSNTNEATTALMYFKNTLISIDKQIPIYKGLYNFDTQAPTSKTISSNTHTSNCLFMYAKKLESIPTGNLFLDPEITMLRNLFRECNSLLNIYNESFENLHNITSCFCLCMGCHKLSSIPSKLLLNNTKVTDCYGVLYATVAITDFDLHIGSPLVTNAANFVSYKSGTTRRIYVPQGSTTQATFEAVADSLGLTIIGE